MSNYDNNDNNNNNNNLETTTTNNNYYNNNNDNELEEFLVYSSEEEQRDQEDEAPLLSHNDRRDNHDDKILMNRSINSSSSIQASQRTRFGGDEEDAGLVHKPPSKSQYLKSAIFGGMDGLTTVFVAVATIFGGDVSAKNVLIVGVAKLLSGAISMGVGDFLSSQAEVQHIKNERNREQWEFTSYPQGEKKEMVELYQEQGMAKEAAEEIVEIMSRRETAFVDVMMVQELGMEPYADPYAPYKNGTINFFSFLVLGCIPLLAYITLAILSNAGVKGDPKNNKNIVFGIDAAITTVTLIMIGAVKARFGDQRWYWSILLTLIVGVLAAGSGYATALGLNKIFGIQAAD